jgi:hypothetical protein
MKMKKNNEKDSYCHYSDLPSPMAYVQKKEEKNIKNMNKWYNYGKWRHPEKRKELMKDREEKITADTRLNRLKDDIRTEFDKIKWMLDEYTQVQHKQIKFRDELIELLTNQVVDLTMMSKIELGDDVIEEMQRLKDIINGQSR